jgi:hypothetical protein
MVCAMTRGNVAELAATAFIDQGFKGIKIKGDGASCFKYAFGNDSATRSVQLDDAPGQGS